MRASHKLLLAPALLGASPVAAQMEPASTGEIGGAIGVCVKATTPTGLDLATLTADGWTAATMTDDGKSVDTTLRFYAKADNEAWILTMVEGDPLKRPCVVQALINGLDVFPSSVSGLSKVFGLPIKREKNEIYWSYNERIIQLALTGSREKPGVRVVVMRVPEEKK